MNLRLQLTFVNNSPVEDISLSINNQLGRRQSTLGKQLNSNH